MSLFRLDASIRVEGSHSRTIADIVEQEWHDAHPGESVIRRHVGVEPIPATAWATAAFAGFTPGESRTDEQRAALALAATLTDELIAADALLFAVPLYNFGVSQHFKTWVDMVITDPRMAAGTQPALDRFTGLARELRQEAEERARRHGRELGAATAAALVA